MNRPPSGAIVARVPDQPKRTRGKASRKFQRAQPSQAEQDRRRRQMKALGDDIGHAWKLRQRGGI